MWISTVLVVLAIAFCTKLLKVFVGLVRFIRLMGKIPSPPTGGLLDGHRSQKPMAPGFKWLQDAVDAFPRMYVLWRGTLPMPVLVHLDTIKPILSKPTGSIKSKIYWLFADWLGEGMATTDGPKWQRNRRLLTKSFHFDILRTYMPIYNDCVEVLLGKMERLAKDCKPLKVDQNLAQCTLDTVLRTACSHQSNCQLQESAKDGELDLPSATFTLTQVIQSRAMGNLLNLIPAVFRFSSAYKKWDGAIKYMQSVSSKLISERKEELGRKEENGEAISKPRDFLDTLLMARDTDGTGLTTKEITDEVNTFLFGGHDTTSSTLTWVLYVLAKYPEHQAKVREEVDELLGNRDSARITSKDLSHLNHMSLLIKEVLRMYAVVFLPTRELTEPYEVDGVTLPIGTTVGINLYQLHHNPTVWGEDHMEFRPSRFLPENFVKMDPFAYLPFSAGPRNCIGQQFGLNQVKVVVARIVRQFSLGLVEGEPEPVPCVNVVVKPMKELLLNVELRNHDDL